MISREDLLRIARRIDDYTQRVNHLPAMMNQLLTAIRDDLIKLSEQADGPQKSDSPLQVGNGQSIVYVMSDGSCRAATVAQVRDPLVGVCDILVLLDKQLDARLLARQGGRQRVNISHIRYDAERGVSTWHFPQK